jgi:tRNA (cmo5U34)-methyltransferase
MSEPTRDHVYVAEQSHLDDFTFNRQVVTVFDDMVKRSVPFYEEIQRMVAELATEFATPGSSVYDLGCSTGTTLLYLHPLLPPSIRFVGIDNSQDMIDRCRAKFRAQQLLRPHELRRFDLNAGIAIENASVVLMLLTLQFIRPLYRDNLLTRIYDGLTASGCLILVEKVIGEDSLLNRLYIKYYYDLKRRNGYSETEISQKREALENVLVPYKLLENREALLRAGFRYVDVFFKWYNFCAMVAIK